MCYEIYFADIKDLGVGFMVVFLNQVFTWRFGQCTNSGAATLSNTKAVLTVKLHQQFSRVTLKKKKIKHEK